MKYYAYGRVLPERADAYVQYNKNIVVDIGSVTFCCEASQITMTLELNNGVQMDPLSAQILCKNHANVIISCLGFSLGCNYVVEMTSLIDDKSVGKTYGVQMVELRYPDDQRNNIFSILLNLSGRDFFLRFAIMDYVRAINTEIELPFLCYRAIETIKGRFKKQLSETGDRSDDASAWAEMHSKIGTSRKDIEIVKNSADMVRHGNYYDLITSSLADRLKYLEVTRDCIIKYKDFLVSEHRLNFRI